MAWHPFRNVGLKVAALGLAVLLWVTISGQQVERNVLVQLQFRNIPGTLELSGDAPRTVDVRVSGAAGLISALEPYQVVATIDLTDARPGLRVFPLTNEQISVPLGVEVKSVDPATISLTLEKSGSARVPIKPTIDGEPAPGFEVADVTWTPQMVDVVGPETRLADLDAVVTERISIEGAKSNVVDTVSVGVTDSAVRLRQAQSARVTIRIVPAPLARFPNLAVDVQHLQAGRRATVQPADVSVTVRGSADAVRQLRDGQMRPYVDATGLRPGRYNLQVRVDPPEGMVVVSVSPTTVAVRVQ
jgi:YbbR domain-containing protein